MIKPLFLFILCLSLANASFAQKRDTSVYYLNAAGKVVSTKDSGDYFLVMLPPDPAVDKNLFIAEGFYRNGESWRKVNLTTTELKLEFHGLKVNLNANWHKMMVQYYVNGEATTDIIGYYPNGKFYNKECFVKKATGETEAFLKDCRDSTGNRLAENGNGKWIRFTVDFNRIAEEGQIVNGRQEGEWRGRDRDSLLLVNQYKNGKKISSKTFDNTGKEVHIQIFTSVEVVPEFPGGLDAFGRYLGKNIHYPDKAFRKGTQGRVIVSFVVERDGSLTDVKVARGIGDGCDEEAVRVISSGPRWKPGIQNGRPVRVAYNVPISFSLGK